MDAIRDLGIGNVLERSLLEIWTDDRMKSLRASFASRSPDSTCAGCDLYRGLELYRTPEGRRRAELNLARHRGEFARQEEKPRGAFAGG